MACAYPEKSFDQFWKWLGSRRKAQTLAGRSHVWGEVDGELIILTSSRKKHHSVGRDTADLYCREAVKRNFEGLTGNKRWIAALYSKFLQN
jgi:hypothetical protein